jgi:hypothetical protein
MNKVIKCIITIFLAILLIQPAFGFSGMSSGTSGNDSSVQPIDFENATDSDQDIVLLQHLVEMDAVKLESANQIFVRETFIFRNDGTQNFLGSLRSWTPDGAEDVRVARVEMMVDGSLMALQTTINGNIVSWNDFIKAKDPLPPLYILEYSLPAEKTGTITKSMDLNKKFIYPTLLTKQPFSIILKVIKGEGESISLTDENGNSISASGNPRDEGDNSVLYGWQQPLFKEFNVEISQPVFTTAKVASYAIPGIIILLILSYPFLRKKSEKLRNIERKITETLKREAEPAEYESEEIMEKTASPVEIDSGLSGKSKYELETEKREIQSKISTLDNDYASGDLLDEEYEELRNKYRRKADAINSMLNTMGGKSAAEAVVSEEAYGEGINAKLEQLYKDHAVGKISYKEFKELKKSLEENL